MDALNLKDPQFYLNREESLLQFNSRVLELAKDESIPLLERLRFLCISSTNLDEFFEIRVAGLKQKAGHGITQTGIDQKSPNEILNIIDNKAHELVDEQYRVLNELLIPELQKSGIRFIPRTEWNDEMDTWLQEYFNDKLLPVISPLGLDPAHPFPRILNKSLNFIVSLQGKDAFGRSSRMAVVQAPRPLPRLIQLPAELESVGAEDYVFLSSVIHAYVDSLFPGMKVKGCYQFRVTRNSELFVDEEEIDDLKRALEGELASRRYGEAVRLEVANDCPEEILDYLLVQFGMQQPDIYQVNGPVNLNRLSAVCDMSDRADLKFPSFTPGLPGALEHSTDIFAEIRKQDILLHHPYESFAPVIDFVRQAASDPDVLAIKQTLYRSGAESNIVDALIHAARTGKEVVVIIELRARFDEAENIALATRLQEAGAHVVYGVVGYKTHAKMNLVVRREGNKLVRYVHLGTGNYHSRNVRIYTDYGLFTCDDEIGKDVHQVFMQLTSLGKVTKLNKLLQSPFTLNDAVLKKIQREMKHAEQGKPAHIKAKMNALVDEDIICALYDASRAGVKIDLIVRGMCCLKPGIDGVSDNITVHSIVGRFLEHHRVYYFQNDNKPEVFCSSADWMERNLHQRVEVCFPIENDKIRKRLTKELDLYLRDNMQSWALQPDGNYIKISPAENEEPCSAQANLLANYAEHS